MSNEANLTRPPSKGTGRPKGRPVGSKTRVQVPPPMVSVSLADLKGEPINLSLFTRSLTLLHFKKDSPLYPMCRAWVENNSGASGNTSQEEDELTKMEVRCDGKSMLRQLRCGRLKNIRQIPLALPTDMSLIPPPLERTKEEKREERMLFGASKDDLLASNMQRWKRVRTHWLSHTLQYNRERFAIIDEVMDYITKE